MKKGFFLLLLILNLSCAKRGVYFSEKGIYSKDEIRDAVKKAAVLPVNYVFNESFGQYPNQVFSNKDNENKDPIANQKMNGLKLQKIIYEELSNAKSETIWLSDKEVNDILDEKLINYHDLRRVSKPEIAKLLNVDAVVYLDVFVGAMKTQQPATIGMVPIVYEKTTQIIEFIVEVHSSSEDDLVWKAKTILGKKAFREEKYFRQIMQSDLAPILPFD